MHDWPWSIGDDWPWRSRMLKKSSVGRTYSTLVGSWNWNSTEDWRKRREKKKRKAWHPLPKILTSMTPPSEKRDKRGSHAWQRDSHAWQRDSHDWLSRFVSLLYVNTYVHNFAKKNIAKINAIGDLAGSPLLHGASRSRRVRIPIPEGALALLRMQARHRVGSNNIFLIISPVWLKSLHMTSRTSHMIILNSYEW